MTSTLGLLGFLALTFLLLRSLVALLRQDGHVHTHSGGKLESVCLSGDPSAMAGDGAPSAPHPHVNTRMPVHAGGLVGGGRALDGDSGG